MPRKRKRQPHVLRPISPIPEPHGSEAAAYRSAVAEDERNEEHFPGRNLFPYVLTDAERKKRKLELEQKAAAAVATTTAAATATATATAMATATATTDAAAGAAAGTESAPVTTAAAVPAGAELTASAAAVAPSELKPAPAVAAVDTKDDTKAPPPAAAGAAAAGGAAAAAAVADDAAVEARKVRIIIRCAPYNQLCKSFAFMCAPDVTIDRLKRRMRNASGVHIDAQRLVMDAGSKRKQLEDNLTIGGLGLQDNAIIKLVLRPRG